MKLRKSSQIDPPFHPPSLKKKLSGFHPPNPPTVLEIREIFVKKPCNLVW
ncbi:hypothetical protein HMPREF1403_00262 [Helicobacter pylori GAM201Ai]|nr:hypothetical protein HMPREF1403_00262 [Helicobacter pylori GAM201Ai]